MHDTRPAPDLAQLQQEDLTSFGRLLLALCCGNASAAASPQRALESIGRHYSPDVRAMVGWLVGKPGPHRSAAQMFDMLGSRLLTEMDEMQKCVLLVYAVFGKGLIWFF
jgi:PAB-dependent poly(A)-specific ribonuclease subunit 3